jgi:hypothetical protein
LVLSRLDYGLSTLAGLPAQELNRLQSVLNAAARVVYSARKFNHITPLLKDLQLSLLIFRCLQGQAPRYLANEIQRTSDVESRRRLRSASTASLVVPPRNTLLSVTAHFRSPLLTPGTVCQMM